MILDYVVNLLTVEFFQIFQAEKENVHLKTDAMILDVRGIIARNDCVTIPRCDRPNSRDL